MSLILKRFLMNTKTKERRMKVGILVVILIYGVSTPIFASGSFPQKKPAEDRGREPKNNGKAIVMIGMAEEQKDGFERVWEKTKPRWEAEENARRLEKQGLISEAIEEYKRAISNSENDFYSETSHCALANLYEKNGQYENALKEVDWYIARFKKMNYPNKDLLNEYIATRDRLLVLLKNSDQQTASTRNI
jgi:tetratricopeptide (TPR) repeat protein